MQVVEISVKKTLNGEATTYLVKAGADATKIVDLNAIDGELFDSSEAARAILVERVTASIVQRVEQAVAKAKEWYPSGFEAQTHDPLSIIKKEASSARAVASTVKPEVAALAAELRAEADEGAMIELPGGVMAKVRNVKLPEALS